MPENFVKRVNRLGVPAIRNINAILSDDRLTITFANHPNVSDFFQGFFVVYITNIPASPETPVPVYLNTEGLLGSDKQLFDSHSVPVPSNEVSEGVYLCFYDSTSGKVRAML